LQFVQAIRCFVDAIDTAKDMSLVKLVLGTAFRICCGEIDELQTDPRKSSTALRTRYMRTIERKTAVLFGLACECGAALGGARTRMAHRLGFYGRRVGRAFQIMDDLFDVMSHDADSGKAQGIDLSSRRMSLPLIYAMEELGADHLVSRMMRGAEFTPEELQLAIRAVRGSNAMSRAWQDARREVYAAVAYLDVFPPSPYRDALAEIAHHVVDRGFSPDVQTAG
jgi:heptaprenyl diphosphate synthase